VITSSTAFAQPRHIAIVMDGNGRWAKRHLLPRTAGHHAGVKTAKTIIEACARKGIETLSLFTFSSENWLRPEEEVSYLQKLMFTSLRQYVKELSENNIRLQFIGDLSRFSKELKEEMHKAHELTKNNKGLRLLIAVNYGGRWDLIQSIQKIALEIQSGKISVQDINAKLLETHLATAGISEPDLFIRTSGEQRISNFFIWQLAYTELFFTDVLWPDFSVVELEKALQCFQTRERRFGYISEQLGAEN
jgi:undecaprenyl diphosphate synthase